MTDAAIAVSIGARMQALSNQLDVCAPLLVGNLVLLDYPVHDNVGDLLIWQGEQAFLTRHGKHVVGQYSIDNIGWRAREQLAACTTICLHGGGNFGDLWPWFQTLREGIIRQFPQKRIVMLPQSVHFTDRQALDQTCGIIGRHPDLHILLRDRRSFSLLNERGVANLSLCPDMAHALWGILSAPEPTRADPLYLFRRDRESVGMAPDIAARAREPVDWEDLLTGWTALAFRLGVKVNERDGRRRLNNQLPAYRIWNRASKLLIGRAIDLFAPHPTIVTDRLHAVILAALLGRKAVAFDNCYGKTSSYVSLWMQDMPSIDMHGRALAKESDTTARHRDEAAA